jgi:hypothetical protein
MSASSFLMRFMAMVGGWGVVGKGGGGRCAGSCGGSKMDKKNNTVRNLKSVRNNMLGQHFPYWLVFVGCLLVTVSEGIFVCGEVAIEIEVCSLLSVRRL